ncbi:MAG: M15 family metallopeptidase [Planctomycetota bacterium JB042]
MRRVHAAALSAALLVVGCAGSDETAASARSDEPLVPVADVHPGIRFDIRYATDDNFTGERLYASDVCLLRASVADRLARVQDRLAAEGLGLLVFDGYRPLSVQRRMWELVPDPRYVAPPDRGSRHNRGAAVDVTLVDAAGRRLEMPTDHDDFTEAAHRDYAGATHAATANRDRLRAAMEAEGFEGIGTEWWHFDAVNWREYDIVGAALGSGRCAGL